MAQKVHKWDIYKEVTYLSTKLLNHTDEEFSIFCKFKWIHIQLDTDTCLVLLPRTYSNLTKFFSKFFSFLHFIFFFLICYFDFCYFTNSLSFLFVSFSFYFDLAKSSFPHWRSLYVPTFYLFKSLKFFLGGFLFFVSAICLFLFTSKMFKLKWFITLNNKWIIVWWWNLHSEFFISCLDLGE